MVDRFDWSPEPDLLDIRDPGAFAPLAGGARGGDLARGPRLALRPCDGAPRARPGLPGGPRDLLRAQPTAGRRRRCPRRPRTRCWPSSGARVAPNTYNAQHPGSFSYFTPPPLPMSIAGEVLSQWIHQGVDVWHAGPIGAFVEEEVTGWLRDLVGFRDGRLGRPDLGRGHGQHHGDDPGARRLARQAPRHTRRPSRQRPGARARVRQRPDPLLDRSGAGRARLPRGHAARGRRRTSGSGCSPARWPTPSPRTARRA